MDQIFVEGIEFIGRHGVTGRERRVGHHCRADVVVDLETGRAAASDNLKHTVDYSRLAEIVVRLGTEESHRLLEKLAHQMALAILAETPAVRVQVTVRKLGMVLPGLPMACGVTVVRGRT